MEAEALNTSATKGPSTISLTPAERIADLNEIDQSISILLLAASDAVEILSNSPSPENNIRSSSAARTAFTHAASTYFSTLSSIEVRLRRQVYALEEAELVKPGDEADARKGRKFGGDAGTSRVGGGPLDPSWLNARASDKVAEAMKQELLSRARDFVERSELKTQNERDAPSSLENAVKAIPTPDEEMD
ncbi:uncharacterized protein A1O9_13026 [Exophiala aquamarina CBS 119918]|uniref:Mediator of RNA polymerase II transcription subunit 11 n=1 Tax=Exophiala aquamarina CBS 119918 TaxID=1182545 RepID=A0A072NU75_9EURO|nr:uncharacterized protein A1O9_13026 [Exophiala aquamarina CBS 119918]KEF50917.1 hypothetical protein A1O9_13026 [Exophiala aquamarina CBS 119918]